MTREQALREIQRPSVAMVKFAMAEAGIFLPQCKMAKFFSKLEDLQSAERLRVEAVFAPEQPADRREAA